MKEPTTFELLADELRRSLGLTSAQISALDRVLSGFGGQEVCIPAASTQRRCAALRRAQELLEAGAETVEVRNRLVSMGLGSRTAYRLIEQARGRRATEAQQ